MFGSRPEPLPFQPMSCGPRRGPRRFTSPPQRGPTLRDSRPAVPTMAGNTWTVIEPSSHSELGAQTSSFRVQVSSGSQLHLSKVHVWRVGAITASTNELQASPGTPVMHVSTVAWPRSTKQKL
eukprot:1512536-Alexandrium_andersonii.AAC.1